MVQGQQIVGEEAKVHSHAGHHTAPVRAQEGSVVPGLHDGELLGPFVDAVGDPVQRRRSLLAWHRGPRRKGLPRRGHGRVDFCRAAGRYLRDGLFIDG
jgi:hypothetical protein